MNNIIDSENSEEDVIFHPSLEISNFNEYNLSDYHENLLTECIWDLYIIPRKKLCEWSERTEQTSHTKIGYIGQHLASVLLNIKGTKTGARGNDCVDGTEVKSCSRVNQSDKCYRCKINMLRSDRQCPKCHETDRIFRNNDSKWLFTIRSEDELYSYLNLDRLLLIVEEYPEFDKQNFNDISITVYEIYPKKDICRNFARMLKIYFSEIYTPNFQKYPKKIPAPKNFWPNSFQFHMCNPVEIFKCEIKNYLTEPKMNILKFIKPNEPRKVSDIAKMPIRLLSKNEKKFVNVKGSYVSVEDKLSLKLR